MAQLRKPIPKTPAQRVQEKIEPYDQVDYGKEPAISKNRATKVSSKDSRTKDCAAKWNISDGFICAIFDLVVSKSQMSKNTSNILPL
jgi:hypothetical protein